MFLDELQDLIDKEPFEPFRIRLDNGDIHNVFNPQNLALQRSTVWIAFPDGNWVMFPIGKICSCECVMADYQGETLNYEA
jgi:hypothetical protein